MGFQVGEAPVLETEVGAGSLESIVEGAVAGSELADSLLEGGVLGGDPLDGLLRSFCPQVPHLAAEFTDVGPLGEDLGVSGLEGVLRVECASAPGRLALVILLGERPGPAFAGLGHGRGAGSSGLAVVREEGVEGVCAAGNGDQTDLGLFAPEAGNDLVDALRTVSVLLGGLPGPLPCGG
ncbi:hypothetical protein ACF082_35150 [Streptomyces lydicus]|uniref:hypothetical protein n=1 Tax=Streptomyces lydicus TaxID=47763 RepID=UPI0036FF907D